MWAQMEFFGSNNLNVKLRGLKNRSFVGEWCKDDDFFPRQTQMFLELLSFGTSLTLFITFNKTAQEFLFFFRVNHTKNLSNEGWTTWQWHVIDFFYHRSICLQDNYFRQFYQISTILHIKNLSRKEIIVQHTIVLP